AERHLQGIAKKVLHISTCLFDAAAPASIRHFAVFCAWPKSKKGGYVSRTGLTGFSMALQILVE
ncbi:MAG: hypothetical protein IKO40_10670, partial [Kiritimatiellae bacterium]|nr:hypothetical protein [Kiritimatiellia bacterium]